MIYSKRPGECRDFRCEWLKGWGTLTERPDRVKYVLDYVVHEEGLKPGLLQIWEAAQGGLDRPIVADVTRQILWSGIWVSHLYLSGRKKLFFPSRESMSETLQKLMEQGGFEVGVL